MTKLNMYAELIAQMVFYLGNVNYARNGYANDNARFEHNAFEGFNALAVFANSIGLVYETIIADVDGVVYYSGIRLYTKDHKYDVCRWCTSCNDRVDHLNYMRMQEYKEAQGIED